jgi:hypothetical protein
MTRNQAAASATGKLHRLLRPYTFSLRPLSDNTYHGSDHRQADKLPPLSSTGRCIFHGPQKRCAGTHWRRKIRALSRRRCVSRI